jgi:hypothetical protein
VTFLDVAHRRGRALSEYVRFVTGTTSPAITSVDNVSRFFVVTIDKVEVGSELIKKFICFIVISS